MVLTYVVLILLNFYYYILMFHTTKYNCCGIVCTTKANVTKKVFGNQQRNFSAKKILKVRSNFSMGSNLEKLLQSAAARSMYVVIRIILEGG